MNEADNQVLEALKGLQTFHAWLEEFPDSNDDGRDIREFAETQSTNVLIQSTAANRMQRKLFRISEDREEFFDLSVCVQKIYMTLRVAVDLSQRFLAEERFADAGSICITKKTAALERFGEDFFHLLAVCCFKLKREKSDSYLDIAVDEPAVTHAGVTVVLSVQQFRLFNLLFEANTVGLAVDDILRSLGYKPKSGRDTLKKLKDATNKKLAGAFLKISCLNGQWVLDNLADGLHS